MWDRLLVDCNIATMDAGRATRSARREWRDRHPGRQDRPGRPAHRAGRLPGEGSRSRCGGAWVTPGLIDCHTHLVFGGTRADEHAMRRAGATYEEIAKAGGGIASTVAKTKAASRRGADRAKPPPPARADAAAASPRSRSSPATASTPRASCGCSSRQARSARTRRCGSCRPCSRSMLCRRTSATAATHYVGEIVDKLIPAVAKAGLGDQRRRLLRDDRLHPRRGRAPVQGGPRPWPARSSSMPSSSRT